VTDERKALTSLEHCRPERTGRTAEILIEAMLQKLGARMQRQFPLCHSIYGTVLKVDFLIENAVAFPDGLVIESKWQQTSGTADEKFPYLVLNIRERFPCPAIIVTGGGQTRPDDDGGARPGAYAWLRKHVGGNLINVLTVEQLMGWMARQTFDPNGVRRQVMRPDWRGLDGDR